MDLRETLARMKPHMGTAALLTAAGVWALVLQSGWQSGDWTGFWSDTTQVRGEYVDTTGKRVETPLEREKRLGIEGSHVNETVYQAKKKVLGSGHQTLGDDVVASPERGNMPNIYRYTERETCMEMKIAYPKRYSGVDCYSTRMTDEPWLPGAPPAYTEETQEAPKPAPAPTEDRRGWGTCARARWAGRIPPNSRPRIPLLVREGRPAQSFALASSPWASASARSSSSWSWGSSWSARGGCRG